MEAAHENLTMLSQTYYMGHFTASSIDDFLNGLHLNGIVAMTVLGTFCSGIYCKSAQTFISQDIAENPHRGHPPDVL